MFQEHIAMQELELLVELHLAKLAITAQVVLMTKYLVQQESTVEQLV